MMRMTRDRLLVRPQVRQASAVLEVVLDERPNVGVILAKGPLARAVEVGQTVRFGEFNFPQYLIEAGGEQFLIIQEADVAGVVEEMAA